jgi:transketolase
LQIITHDSVLIGEDGPTHQSVEQIVGLRAMPNMQVFRPSNAAEVKAAFITWLQNKKPTTIILAKQKVKTVESELKDACKGAYILEEEKGKLDLILMATGSEVESVLEAKAELEKLGLGTRIVSMPSFEVFDAQEDRYKNSVLPKKLLKRVAVEAGSSYSFYKYIGFEGKIIGVDEFGASGKIGDLMVKFGLTQENVVEVAKSLFSKKELKK